MQLRVKIENINHQGSGIAKIDNKITFIPKTIENDLVDIKITKEHKNYNEAKLLKIITPSPNRISYPCPYYDKCGGCHIANLPYELQLKTKQEKVKNIFKKYNELTIEPEIIPSEQQQHYRNKVTLQVDNQSIGFYEEKSHTIIPINKCLLVTDKINTIIKALESINKNFIESIVIREIESKIMINILGKIDKESIINILKDKCNSIYLNSNLIHGEKKLIETLNNYKFIISPDSFFQVNIPQTINLYNQILKYANPTKKDKILDLYCGTGTIGIYLSKYCQSVLGIEINPYSIENAKYNKKINKVNNITFKLGDVSKLLDQNYKANIIVVDPPRNGLDKHTIKTILELSPQKIIYVSCNPITLSRDFNLLKEKYILEDIKLYDMFPQTYHVECVSLLHRKPMKNKN